MTRNELITTLISAGYYLGWWMLDDDQYAPVSPEFIHEAHAEWINSLPWELRTTQNGPKEKKELSPRWIVEAWDCDNVSRDYGVFLSRCMAVDAVKTGVSRGNIAAGKINFFPTPDTRHAINWFVDHAGKVHCFDALSGEMDHLTPVQVESIFEGESV